ncbi:hypothetical protein [Halegenticoccus tardaugens]|uniref:hypothetical protein n=1 Tax=Halegenticoccus tardaugens TaxID=2071624 RepID=UPI00100BD982|nr:hypothetical protein [Halegenticoccus tardaugens]
MCLYCNAGGGWERLLDYDDVYQRAVVAESSASSHGFHESWDELREQTGWSAGGGNGDARSGVEPRPIDTERP